MASSRFFPIDIPISSTTIIIIALLVGGIWIATRPKQYSPVNVKPAPDGQPGNPTGQQGIDYRQQAPLQQPYLEPGANIIPGGNSWI